MAEEGFHSGSERPQASNDDDVFEGIKVKFKGAKRCKISEGKQMADTEAGRLYVFDATDYWQL